ncbi:MULTISPECIES: polyphosphate polymerase domain-containing protein [Intestinimonas]|uniref:VTC domain-containing protein n=1 Tax=Intestinimonas butyriciproducens TaxID=1297617 RepID=A0A2U1CEK2_9FIRM|nr:polyphosphate polymerase domain-containing protein [Intestinimonas butyriciproducens]MCB7049438.1 polyphosphate polymerase domain-containing protein [Intestinimonas butyriciproducens]MCI6362260.1 polyphosphate polymerase domain-containing protein [Intestinimonas butyriciproducens]MCR1905523.1 polyphosphate polymerase domain-containing protein [Intestinimonas butyriciproducens]MDY3615488.1 polyphosphate polymerase domain-containing protein [Intestinimonas butyriciproducens]PVY59352.1 VTC dom
MPQNIQRCFQRYEKKYLLNPEQYQKIRAGLAPYMEADEHGRYTICNLYYDTPDFQLIRASLDKPVYKEKLRMRSYGVPADGDSVFVELKKKYKGVVYKRRTVLEAGEALDYLAGRCSPRAKDQICREIDWFLGRYHPVPQVFIAYDREALAGLEDRVLRVTFDIDLRWRDTALDLRSGDGGERITSRDQILMEIKIPGSAPVWLSRLLSENSVFPTSFSKYGVCYRENLMWPVKRHPGKAVRFCA